MNRPHSHHHIYEQCKAHMNAYVLAELNDGTKVDGIITDLDEDFVYLAIPIQAGSPEPMGHYPYYSEDRQFGFGYLGYGFPGYGYPGYGYGYPGQRFRRLVLPLTALVALSALPWY
ncbi:hypothetical protein [Sediminibacillus albus]|uniref:Uncharacterized protein n=1 Tax=Sediminibacillus albus TaxID=407036 RepID=A0A1G8XAH0_9BACI|nr:hypothetical protein [Sediminibacillus albus]SDJ87404.1 hypothetical protein SAMN05216243_1249 [Sediminibacillus albus]